jgi:hypothetical protein
VVVIVWRPWLEMQQQTCFVGVIELVRLEWEMTAWKVPLTDGGFEKQQNLETTMSLDGSWHQGWV